MNLNKLELIEKLEKDIDDQINITVSQFQNLDQDKLLITTPEGGWSIAQNLQHLNLYFDYYLPAISDALENAQKVGPSSDFKSGILGNYFTKSMDYRRKGKIKAFKDYIPPKELNPYVVIEQFITNQEDLLKLLRKSKDYNVSKIKVAISLTKWVKINLGDVFRFVIMHNERHVVQAQSRIEYISTL